MSKISVSEASKLLGVSTKTLYRWEEQGKLKPERTRGGHRRY
ncbi:MAG: MerR family DNA-binding transcriptional regulator, partial [Leptolyngbyaceae cyanobacterium]